MDISIRNNRDNVPNHYIRREYTVSSWDALRWSRFFLYNARFWKCFNSKRFILYLSCFHFIIHILLSPTGENSFCNVAIRMVLALSDLPLYKIISPQYAFWVVNSLYFQFVTNMLQVIKTSNDLATHHAYQRKCKFNEPST